MPHIIVPEHPVQGRELKLVNAANDYWNLVPFPPFHQRYPDAGIPDYRVVLIQKEKRRSQGFDKQAVGAGGVPLGLAGAADGRSFSLQLSFPMHPGLQDVLNAFNALGIVQMPRNDGREPGFTSPCAGAPFYGTVPADYQNERMTLPEILKFFRDLGFTIQIDTGYAQPNGPVQNGLPAGVWEAVCGL